jgi:hypothetical protein
LVPWGSWDRSGPLPVTPWTLKASVEEGAWAGVGCETEPCVIAARYGFERGVWFLTTEGIHGLLVRPPDAPPVVYMVCEPSTHHYRVMTRSDRMPWLVGEMIRREPVRMRRRDRGRRLNRSGDEATGRDHRHPSLSTCGISAFQ